MSTSSQFIADRLLFAGLPFGDLRRTIDQAQASREWRRTFCDLADTYAQRARAAAEAGHGPTAYANWRWAAIALQGASFELHVAPERHRDCTAIEAIRREARSAYHAALAHQPRHSAPCRSVSIVAGGDLLDGYLSTPAGAEAKGVVVVVNGLDSIAEVELQAFGHWFIERDLAVLALNLPVDFIRTPRTARVDARAMVPAICDWLEQDSGLDCEGCGAFGVSFGGYLVAQFLSSDPRVRCGAAICPPAWMGPSELAIERIRIMWAYAVARPFGDFDALVDAMPDVRELAPPRGDLMLYGCEGDPVFGDAHLRAYRDWGGDRVDNRMMRAEHVGTSRVTEWLPDVADWMGQCLSGARAAARPARS